MTPANIEVYARAQYNAASDSFFTTAEIQYYIYQAELELFNETMGIVEVYQGSINLTSGTRQYAFSANVRAIKRIEFVNLAGIANKLEPITFREDDALTLVNVASTTLGSPQFYETFNYNIYLRPVPDTTNTTLNIYSYNEPAAVLSGVQVLEIPSNFHMDIVDFVTMRMYSKDKNPDMYTLFKQRWDEAKVRAKRYVQKKKRTDAFTVVMNEDNLAVTLTGPV